MGRRTRGGLEGRRIIGATAVVLVLITALAMGVADTDARRALWLTVLTARLSLVLFLLTFVASAINGLWRGPRGKWLLRNRRFLGLSFALSHTVHAFAFSWFAHARGTTVVAMVDTLTLVGGLTGYGFLALMVLTSHDAAVRWLGRRWWTALHRTGMYVLYLIFVFSYVGRALDGRVLGMVTVVVLLAALGLRAAHRLRRRAVTAA